MKPLGHLYWQSGRVWQMVVTLSAIVTDPNPRRHPTRRDRPSAKETKKETVPSCLGPRRKPRKKKIEGDAELDSREK